MLLNLKRLVLKSLTLTLKRMLSGLCERVKSEESHALKIMKCVMDGRKSIPGYISLKLSFTVYDQHT